VDFDIVSYLASKGLRGKQVGEHEIAYPCFFCGESSSSIKRKLYVNRQTNFWQCFVCLEHGGSYLIQKHFGDDPKKTSEEVGGVSRYEVLDSASRLAHEMCVNSEVALEYLLEERRGLSAEAIVSRRIGYVPRLWSLSGELSTKYPREAVQAVGLIGKDGRDYYSDRIIIPYFQDGRVVQLRGKDINGRYYTATGDRVRLFGADDVRGASDVILTEGEFDAMIVSELLSKGDDKAQRFRVCAIPGANTWPEDADHILRDAKRIFIGCDPDETGRKAADKLAEQIGPRARILTYPEELLSQPIADGLAAKDIDWTSLATSYGLTWQDVMGMVRTASGRRLLTLAEAGSRLRSRQDQSGLKTGFSEFDSWITPGLLPGQVMIPLARTGVGKSLVLCNIAYNNRHNPVLFITLEMTAEEVYERMCRIYRFYYPHATDDEVDAALSNIMICDENRLSERDLDHLIDEFEYETGLRPRLMLVDYLGYYARGVSGGSPYEKTSNAVMQLKAEAKKHRLVVIAPHQVNRGTNDGRPIEASDARDSGVVEETADFLVSVFRPDEGLTIADQPTGILKMQILKSRHGNRDRIASLQMGVLSLVITDASSRWAKAARDEAHLAASGYTYSAYLKKRTQPIQQEISHAV